jgi:acetyl-CoA carboxylase biotin carboxyl carrier protein
MSDQTLTLKAEPRQGGGWQLLSPAVGLYAKAPKEGSMYRAGDCCANLVVLDQVMELKLPLGVIGYVATAPPERKHKPVEFGQVLFELIPAVNEELELAQAGGPQASASGLPVLVSPQAGRFYRNPDPDSPPFVEDGSEIGAGKTVGLLEVMKTFNPVKYSTDSGLPAKARVVRFLVEDSSDVDEGQPLMEVEAL